jgi:hypothetical protein
MIVHRDKLRWLFWLRWKMFSRGFTARNASHIIGAILLFLFVILGGGALAVGSYFAYRFLPAPANMEMLFLVLSGIFLLWIFLPLLEFTTNEGLDISKLALFPLTRAELMISLLASTLLDIPTIGLFLMLGAVVVAWSYSLPLVLLTLLAMVIFYVQLVAVSQLVLALLQDVLHSRRFRDLSVIVIILLSSSGYLCQLAIRSNVSLGFIQSLLHAQYSQYLRWLPSGMAASAIQQASLGNWGLSFLWLLVLVAITCVFLYLWQSIVERGLTAGETGGTVKTARRRRAGVAVPITNTATGVPAVEQAGLLARLFPTPVRALIGKDIKYFWRDPQIKAVLIQSFISIAFLIVYLGITTLGNNGGRGLASIGGFAVLVVPLLVMLTLFSLSYNTLGFERQSISTLLLFPIDPRAILWAKNIATFVIGLSAGTILILITAIITRGWLYVGPAFVILIAGTCLNVGLGNFTSVMFPQKMRLARRGMGGNANMSAQGGCLRGFISMLSFYVMLIFLLPVAAAVIVPLIFHQLWIWAIGLPLSLAYGIGLYVIVTYLVAPRILTKAPEIIQTIGKE